MPNSHWYCEKCDSTTEITDARVKEQKFACARMGETELCGGGLERVTIELADRLLAKKKAKALAVLAVPLDLGDDAGRADLRDRFACAALTGLLAGDPASRFSRQRLRSSAYGIAEIMIAGEPEPLSLEAQAAINAYENAEDGSTPIEEREPVHNWRGLMQRAVVTLHEAADLIELEGGRNEDPECVSQQARTLGDEIHTALSATASAPTSPSNDTIIDEILSLISTRAAAMSDAEITRQLAILWTTRQDPDGRLAAVAWDALNAAWGRRQILIGVSLVEREVKPKEGE